MFSSAESIRVVIRSQNKDSTQCNWLQGYTCKDIENFQREDLDLKYLHEWLDNNTQPSRDQAASFSPAVRVYWLNFNLLERRHVVLYQKHLSSDPSSTTYQLLFPKILRKEFIKNDHDTCYEAHFGISKTVDKIKRDFH